MSTSEPRPDFSDVKGGSTSSAGKAAPGSAAKDSAETTYTVRAGDSLSKIAKAQYGDASKWRRIFEANRDQIDNPDLIHPGQVFKIPAS
ncbi:MAG TPA: LysM peptidoglycan-binding domain-containing protein [Gemmatimonadaceae bacterium]|nr:LysM peptidoglycan-binding domain-containing protein [Gemmatimonadaceae bacterium]